MVFKTLGIETKLTLLHFLFIVLILKSGTTQKYFILLYFFICLMNHLLYIFFFQSKYQEILNLLFVFKSFTILVITSRKHSSLSISLLVHKYERILDAVIKLNEGKMIEKIIKINIVTKEVIWWAVFKITWTKKNNVIKERRKNYKIKIERMG